MFFFPRRRAFLKEKMPTATNKTATIMLVIKSASMVQAATAHKNENKLIAYKINLNKNIKTPPNFILLILYHLICGVKYRMKK